MRRPSYVFALAIFVAACGPNSEGGGGPGGDGVDGGGGGSDDPGGETAAITGTVWAPGNAPGMVPAGHEIPVFDAQVWLSATRPAPVEQTAHCEMCTTRPSGTRTDHAGNFTLTAVPQTYWLVIEKGQFRLEREITVTADQTMELSVEQTTLPSVHDPEAGNWTPRIALASGIFDDMEDILGKMGLGEVDDTGKFVANSAAGAFDVYSNGGAIDGVALGTLTDLVSDLDKMLQYHIIFIPCGGSANTQALMDEQVLHNIRDYVAAGGKLYVTDWSGEWSDNVFPEQVSLYDGTFGGSADTPPEAWDPMAESWNTSMFGNADGSPSYTSDHAEAADSDLLSWLDRQTGPYATGGSEGPFDATDFDITGNWNHIDGLTSVMVGTDDEGNPVEDVPKVYIKGDDGLGAEKKPLTVTYEPAGCGRVLYSTYHTTDNTHVGLVPQERVLLYLIMEIGECKDGPVID